MGVNSGCVTMAIGEKTFKTEEARAKELLRVLVLLALRNTHNAKKRAAAQRALVVLADNGPSLRSLVLAHHSISSQANGSYQVLG